MKVEGSFRQLLEISGHFPASLLGTIFNIDRQCALEGINKMIMRTITVGDFN
jgi:hypothetical protein